MLPIWDPPWGGLPWPALFSSTRALGLEWERALVGLGTPGRLRSSFRPASARLPARFHPADAAPTATSDAVICRRLVAVAAALALVVGMVSVALSGGVASTLLTLTLLTLLVIPTVYEILRDARTKATGGVRRRMGDRAETPPVPPAAPSVP